MDYLTFALAKGRLANDTLDMFNQIGYPFYDIKDKSRKLIFENDDLKIRFFLSKTSDVPTYVEYGAADVGVVGRDTILEEKRNLYELISLDYGKCKMSVAALKNFDKSKYGEQNLRVATKYPKIAYDFFYNEKRQSIEIIKLNGSVELAPIVGLADLIVDIVETGNTLKANGLEVIEDIIDLSARMVVNRVSMKMKHDRISELVERIRDFKENAND